MKVRKVEVISWPWPQGIYIWKLNFFFLETTWPVLTKEMKICERDAGHMTKMAATPIYGKNSSKIFFSWTRGPISTKLGM